MSGEMAIMVLLAGWGRLLRSQPSEQLNPTASNLFVMGTSMSWKATAWVKSVRGVPSYAARTLLYTLADYYDDERGYAWPSIPTLIEDCEMPERTVKWVLSQLQVLGFITRLQKGNQHQPSHWQLNLDIARAQSYEGAMHGNMQDIARAQIGESAIGESAKVARSGEGAISGIVKVQKPASESAIPVGTNPQEPTIEPTLSERGRKPKPITAEFIEELVVEFSPRFGSNGQVREAIEEALNHKAMDKRKDKRIYLRGWLRRDADRMGGSYDRKPWSRAEAIRREAAERQSHPAR